MQNDRLSIAASFADKYYNTLVESPATLSQYYAATASADHLNHKAKGEAELRNVLTTTHTSKTYTSVTIESIRVTCTPSGNVVANMTGALHMTGQSVAQPFTHEVELRETQPRCYAITRDVFRHKKAATAQSTMNWASATPLMFAAPNQKHETPMEPLQQPTTTAEVAQHQPSTTVGVAEASTTSHKTATTEASVPAPVASEPAVDLSKLSFAERLRLTKGQAAQSTTAAPIRVIGTSAEAAAAADAEKHAKKGDKKGDKKGEKKPVDAAADHKKTNGKGAAHSEKPSEGKKEKDASAAPARPKKAPARSTQPLVFYDIIVKGLADGTTEDQVRAMVKPDVAISKIKVESKASRRDPTDKRTFAFIQLNREGVKEEVKTVVGTVLDYAKEKKLVNETTVMEEVHERKTVTAEKH